MIVAPGVERGDDEGLPLGHEADVAEKCFVDDMVDGLVVVTATIRHANDLVADGLVKRLHLWLLSGRLPEREWSLIRCYEGCAPPVSFASIRSRFSATI